MIRSRGLPLAVAVGLVWGVLPGTARAHGGETTGPHDAPLAVGLFFVGVAVAGTSAYLDATRDVDRRYADAGVLIGVGSVLVSIAAYWLG